MKAHITDYPLYRWRYAIGYTAIILVAMIMIAVATIYVPGAIRDGEVKSALASGSLSITSIDPSSVVNLPYHALQRISFMLFGVTTLSIKLPSTILGVLTALGIFLLTRSWFRRNTAVLATILAMTTTQFLFLTQDGTPAIMYSFIVIWLFTICTYITRNRLFSTLWKVLAGVLMALALYIPLGLYIDIALIVTMSFHPHIRYIIKRIPRLRLILAIVLGIASVTPLVYAIILRPTIALTLLGLPATYAHVGTQLVSTGQDLFGFFATSSGYTIRPLYSLGAVMLMAIGVYRLFTVKYTARSYAIGILSICTLVVLAVNPNQEAALFPLAALFITVGTAAIIGGWYRLFPHNPYARVAGLIPLTILALGMVYSGVIPYIDNYTYNGTVLSFYSNDLRLLSRNLSSLGSHATTTKLVVTPDEAPFYSLVARYDKRFTVATSLNHSSLPSSVTHLIVTHKAHLTVTTRGLYLSRIVTNRKATNADRLYLYTTAPDS